MGAHDLFRVFAILLAFATVGILIATGRVKNGWMIWLAIPALAFLWYWAVVYLYTGYYMLRVSGVRG